MKIIESTKEYYWKESNIDYSTSNANTSLEIKIDVNKKYQRHLGFGGAFTSSSSYLINKESRDVQEEFINAYFSKEGLNYNLGRLPIHSTDFSPESYVYTKDDDRDLSSFDISIDYPRFDLVKECIKKANGLWMLTSPWSPLPWMKDNLDMCHGGKLMKEYYSLWAEYQLKFIESVEKYGIPIDAMTIQNEPLAKQVWESCIYTGEEEGIFIRDHLYPKMKEKGLEKKILIWDHNRDLIPQRADETLSLDGLNEIVWGLGYHWYCSTEYENLTKFHNKYPDKHLLLTECCVETAWDSTTGKSSKIGIYEHGERYGKQIINDLNNYSEGYIDWNLVLNEIGGPNHVGNYCEAPLILNEKEHKIYYMPSYYYIGHFSKYIEKGAFRLSCLSNIKGVYATSYLNNDNKIVIIAMNENENDVNVNISFRNNHLNYCLKSHSIITLLEE
jgi:glucosylceramidase